MSQSLTVEKLPQSEGFLHKYESSAVYQEQQEFLEDGKHVSLVGDSVEYLEVEPQPTTPPEPAYYFTGEGGEGLYTAKIPLINLFYDYPSEERPDNYFYAVNDAVDADIDQQIADWFNSAASLTRACKIRYKFDNGQWSEWDEGSELYGMHEKYNCPYPNTGYIFLSPGDFADWECPLIENPTDQSTTLYVEMEMEQTMGD